MEDLSDIEFIEKHYNIDLNTQEGHEGEKLLLLAIHEIGWKNLGPYVLSRWRDLCEMDHHMKTSSLH